MFVFWTWVNPARLEADMSQPQLPPIYHDCRRLLLHTEASVQRFSRYHKYTVGADLRQQAMVWGSCEWVVFRAQCFVKGRGPCVQKNCWCGKGLRV